MVFEQITVGELEALLSNIKDKDKVVEIHTDDTSGIVNATSFREYADTVIIG